MNEIVRSFSNLHDKNKNVLTDRNHKKAGDRPGEPDTLVKLDVLQLDRFRLATSGALKQNLRQTSQQNELLHIYNVSAPSGTFIGGVIGSGLPCRKSSPQVHGTAKLITIFGGGTK